MPKPTIYFQSTNAGALPDTQDSFRYTEETESGTLLTGDAVAASTGIHLGALTNLSESDEYNVIITHSAVNPITGVQFYYRPTTNVRTGGVGFTHTDDQPGANDDFTELISWGDNNLAGETFGLQLYGFHETTPTILGTGIIDELATAKLLDNNAKFDSNISSPGTSIAEHEDWIEPFEDYVSNDAAGIKIKLSVPDIEDAGIRQAALYTRVVYTF